MIAGQAPIDGARKMRLAWHSNFVPQFGCIMCQNEEESIVVRFKLQAVAFASVDAAVSFQATEGSGFGVVGRPPVALLSRCSRRLGKEIRRVPLICPGLRVVYDRINPWLSRPYRVAFPSLEYAHASETRSHSGSWGGLGCSGFTTSESETGTVFASRFYC